ncbi:dicarboxylate/amino acid:cation symporter [Legionella worsleiensis]|uniref:Sodium:dicarboxylate symporter protein n=1 Tax=Legionella worsleiensis TaxID=45076 RepID=A0A0W1ALB3_9GAMM|nr:dicarboxylate/amino acid:cation symporter [Legionella worsleiensis]KTD82133.1 sodium:dicarboxylate symporter protein [Legionella worsleiensis]STY31402.1 sodium:dicarboxylate symporter protein [Legionella worsleiensis]
MTSPNQIIKSYRFPVILITSILLGALAGSSLNGDMIQWLKPLGDIFLNLIFTAIVPMIFFSVSSAIARSESIARLRALFITMSIVFVFTGLIAAIYAMITVHLFPPAEGIALELIMPEQINTTAGFSQLSSIFTVSDFSKLLSHEHILALIVFAILVGLAVVTSAKDKRALLTSFLHSGEELFMNVFGLIMYYAPIGFFAYFAVMVNDLGTQLLNSYLRIALVYYSAGLVYFLVFFTGYAYLAQKKMGIKLFWHHIFLPMITAIGTCSSAASIPASLAAARQMKISPEVYETVIPLGTIIHKEGSVLGGVFKIAFLFGVFHLDFSGLPIILTALGISLLVGTVMGAIPSGGMLGELLILNVYGFPPSALIAVAAISIIIDPLATLINVTGNTVSSMMIDNLLKAKTNKKEQQDAIPTWTMQ